MVLFWFAVAVVAVDNNPRLLLSNVACTVARLGCLHICLYFGYLDLPDLLGKYYYQSVFARGLRGHRARYRMHGRQELAR